MRFRTRRQQKHRWREFDEVVRELRAFIASQPEDRQNRMPTQREVLEVRSYDILLPACLMMLATLAQWSRVSLQLHLVTVQAGRNDLRYALQLHSHLHLAEAVGVAPSRRGGYHKCAIDVATVL